MRTMTLHLHDALRSEEIDGVVSFVGEDPSGSFGLLPGHDRFVTCLAFGLARFRRDGEGWRFLAVPGAVLHCTGEHLYLATRRYLVDTDYERISAALRSQLLRDELQLRDVKASLQRLEDEVLQRLWSLDRKGEGP